MPFSSTPSPRYTTIRLDLAPAILEADGISLLDASDYVISITSPAMIQSDAIAPLPNIINKRIKVGQSLILKLLPSDTTIPRGKYKVTYAKAERRNNILFKEEWIIPSSPRPKETSLFLNPSTLTYLLPEQFAQLEQIQSLVVLPSFSVYQRELTFESPPPEVTVVLLYNGYLTRSEIVYAPTTWNNFKRPGSAADAFGDYYSVYY
jgi:hypothetical protein